MNNVNKELPKALTIEDLKNRVNKPVFLAKYNEISNRVDLRWVIFKSLNQEILEFTEGVEDLKIGDNICFFDIEVSEEELKQYIEQELAEILTSEKKEKKKTGYERVLKEKYYTVSGKIQTVNHCDDMNNFDDEKYNIANYFNNNPLCENIARAERLKYQLRRFAALNGGIPSVADWFSYSSWEDGSNWKYSIQYNYENQRMQINCTLTNKSFGQIYFKSEEACKKAIETFKDELLWYFTEFKEMLY